MRRAPQAQRGQTIIIALLVLLLLAFVGGLFVTLVTRNLANAGRQNRVLTADYYAEAGIRYANDQLTNSLEGADWRPPLLNRLAAPPTNPAEQVRYNLSLGTLPAVQAGDPDKTLLEEGFTRYNVGTGRNAGRFLLRVTYDPVGLSAPVNPNVTAPGNASPYSSPTARYIKIESVGREGAVDPHDPTTFGNVPPTRLAATLVAYKPVGITDYARFETDPDRRSDVMPLGVPSVYDATNKKLVTSGVFDFDGSATQLEQYPIITTYGAPDAFLLSGKQLVPNPTVGSNLTPPAGYTAVLGGGSIRSNASLRFYGQNNIYLNTAALASGAYNSYGDDTEVAGDILLDSFNPGNALDVQQALLNLNPPAPGSLGTLIFPSSQPGFSTESGAIRDGRNQNDANGFPRNISRLEPPAIDTVNPATNLPRYRDIAENSPPRIDPKTNNQYPVTPGQPSPSVYGYGQAIYVDNANDVQNESSVMAGGHTLPDDWINRTSLTTAGTKGGWAGDLYSPPGVTIVLGRQNANVNGASSGTQTFYGVRLTRSDTDPKTGEVNQWKDPTGTTTVGTTMYVPYDALGAGNIPGNALKYGFNPNNDVIIYAEGNVRVRGCASADPGDTANPTDYGAADDAAPRHITIVTNGTAYIEGNLLKGNPDSSISVLARDYVCVNTTQFFAGPEVEREVSRAPGDPPLGASTDTGNLESNYLDFQAGAYLVQDFSFGLPYSTPNAAYGLSAAGGSKLALYLSGKSADPAGDAMLTIDAVDPRTGQDQGGNTPPVVPPTAPLWNPQPIFPGSGGAPLQHMTFDISGNAAVTGLLQSHNMQLWTYETPTPAIANPSDANATEDPLVERVAILPMDIRIEAVLFAQNRSFFVIPGPWFSGSDPTDNVDNYSKGTARPGIDAASADQSRYPFYGQPPDLRIIIYGAVSEARPAPISDQSDWMQKWGWIPQYHGSLVPGNSGGLPVEPSGHPNQSANMPGIGLSLIHDPMDTYPYDPTNGRNGYLRMDDFGRPLPVTPKLPVSAGLLYAGQSTEQPLLR